MGELRLHNGKKRDWTFWIGGAFAFLLIGTVMSLLIAVSVWALKGAF